MKFNWGTGLTLFFIFFAVSMITAVVATTKHSPQMVQKDYYALDLNYQERLEKKQNTAALAEMPQVGFDASAQMIQVKFPEGMTAKSGIAKCYRAATTRDDFSTKIENKSVLDIPAGHLTGGRWHIELDWESAEGVKYFWETAFTI